MNIGAHPIARPSSSLAKPSQVSKIEPERALDTMESYFDGWDRDQNGQVAWSEVRENIASPHIKGDEAVALATLYALIEHDASYRGLEKKPPVTLDKLFDYYYEYDAYDDASSDEGRPVADAYFEKFQNKLARASTELFPQGLPQAQLGTQGSAPSCGFLATTYAQAKKDPGSIQEAIHELPNGQLAVRFPGLARAIKVDPVTDTERALFSTAEDNGTWITTLEKAWGQYEASNNKAAFEQSTYPEDAIAAWTNSSAKTTRIPKQPKPSKSGEVPDFLVTAQRALAADKIVVAWTRFEGVDGTDFVPGHAYTVTGIDAEEGTISLRNPWGKLEPSDENHKALDGKDDGLFSYPLSEFHTKFQKLARQTG